MNFEDISVGDTFTDHTNTWTVDRVDPLDMSVYCTYSGGGKWFWYHEGSLGGMMRVKSYTYKPKACTCGGASLRHVSHSAWCDFLAGAPTPHDNKKERLF